jgi:hypothetical protein
MMKKIFIILITVLLSSTINGQNIVIIDRDTLDFLNIINTDTLYQVRRTYYKPRMHEERQRLQYLNSNPIDSSGVSFRYYPRLVEDLLYSSEYDRQTKKTMLYNIDLQHHRLNPLLESDVFLPKEGIWSDKSDGKVNGVVLKYLPDENKVIEFNDLSEFFSYEEISGLGDQICRTVGLNQFTVLVETCVFDGGIYDFKYYLVTSKEVGPLNFSALQADVETLTVDEEELFRLNFYFSHSEFEFLMASVDYGNLPDHTDLIFSKDLKDTTHIIQKHQPWEIIGENIQGGKNQFFYLRSKLDDGKKIIVSYKIEERFEKTAHQIFKGQVISKDQLKTFNEDQLAVLKNLVFAKHNYGFNSEFYQAYFNLFKFYNDEKKRASRTKDMTDLLTEADLSNLETIKKSL